MTDLFADHIDSDNERPLADRYRFLMFDGVVLKRKSGAGAKKRFVLVALGITEDGKKEVLLLPCKHMCLCSKCADECLLKTIHADSNGDGGVVLSSIIRPCFTAESIPSVVNGDLNDLRLISDEQTKTNVEAFIEQLAENK